MRLAQLKLDYYYSKEYVTVGDTFMVGIDLFNQDDSRKETAQNVIAEIQINNPGFQVIGSTPISLGTIGYNQTKTTSWLIRASDDPVAAMSKILVTSDNLGTEAERETSNYPNLYMPVDVINQYGLVPYPEGYPYHTHHALPSIFPSYQGRGDCGTYQAESRDGPEPDAGPEGHCTG